MNIFSTVPQQAQQNIQQQQAAQQLQMQQVLHLNQAQINANTSNQAGQITTYTGTPLSIVGNSGLAAWYPHQPTQQDVEAQKAKLKELFLAAPVAVREALILKRQVEQLELTLNGTSYFGTAPYSMTLNELEQANIDELFETKVLLGDGE